MPNQANTYEIRTKYVQLWNVHHGHKLLGNQSHVSKSSHLNFCQTSCVPGPCAVSLIQATSLTHKVNSKLLMDRWGIESQHYHLLQNIVYTFYTEMHSSWPFQSSLLYHLLAPTASFANKPVHTHQRHKEASAFTSSSSNPEEHLALPKPATPTHPSLTNIIWVLWLWQ